MQALFTPDQDLVAETATRMARGGWARSRAVLNGSNPTDGPTDELLGGWAGLGIAEDQGGAGGSVVEAALLVHALGEGGEPGPFLSHFLAVHALAGAGIAATLLGGVERAVLVENGLAGAADAALAVTTTGEGWILSEIVGREAARPLDPARRSERVELGRVIARGDGFDQGLARIRVLLAAEACGVARGAVALASDYARTRVQFGRPIGSYQAIGHRLAQAAADIETAWSLTLHAAWAITDAPELASGAARMAKASAGDAAIFAAEACTQTHGGMGITREADPHLYLKRAFSIDAAWGGAARLHREIGESLLTL